MIVGSDEIFLRIDPISIRSGSPIRSIRIRIVTALITVIMVADPDFKQIQIRISDTDPVEIRISDFKSRLKPDFGFQIQIKTGFRISNPDFGET
jgi:hypothetical protein